MRSTSKALILLFVLSGFVIGQESKPDLEATPFRAANFSSASDPSWHFRIWQNGSLITSRLHAQGGIAVAVFDENGVLKREARLAVAGAVDSSVRGTALMPDGMLVVGVTSIDREGRIASFIGVAHASADIRPVFRTNPFVPTNLCAGPGNTVWAYGWERAASGNPASSYPSLREFSLERGQLRAVLDRSMIHTSLLWGRYPQEFALHCTESSVVLFNGASGQLFVFDLAASQVSSWQAPVIPMSSQTSSVEVTDSGEVFATMIRNQSGVSELFHLQRDGKRAEWAPFGRNPVLGKGIISLLGSSGNDLIFQNSRDMSAEWRRIKP